MRVISNELVSKTPQPRMVTVELTNEEVNVLTAALALRSNPDLARHIQSNADYVPYWTYENADDMPFTLYQRIKEVSDYK